jgi:hypothetical protein
MEELMEDLKQFNLNESKINEQPNLEESVMEPAKKKNLTRTLVIAGIVLGIGAGFFFAQKNLLIADEAAGVSTGVQSLTDSTSIKKGDVFGSADEKTFRDQAEGILLAGGIDGEGSHHIERGANKTQWVYITSSVVDLDLLVGSRVAVWGETNQGKKAGWLMDVGRVKVLELNAAPVEESTENE